MSPPALHYAFAAGHVQPLVLSLYHSNWYKERRADQAQDAVVLEHLLRGHPLLRRL